MDYNIANVGTEGGLPEIHPAFASGQDGFIASLNSSGIKDQTYYEALTFCQRSTREDGIDAALDYFGNGTKLDALLVPPDVGQTYQIAAQAGYPVITLPAGVADWQGGTGMPLGWRSWGQHGQRQSW